MLTFYVQGECSLVITFIEQQCLYCSYEKQLYTASDHLMSFIEGREKTVVGTTYKELRDLVQKIHDCHYFDANKRTQEEKKEEVDGIYY